jgi:hypothetical protein
LPVPWRGQEHRRPGVVVVTEFVVVERLVPPEAEVGVHVVGDVAGRRVNDLPDLPPVDAGLADHRAVAGDVDAPVRAGDTLPPRLGVVDHVVIDV